MNMHVSTQKFKVGDRVREADGSGLDLSRHWKIHWARPGDPVVTEFFVTALRDGGKVAYSANPFGAGPQVDSKHLTLVTPTFKIGDRVQGACLDPEEDPGTINGFNGSRYSVKWDSDASDAKCFIWPAEELYLLPAATALRVVAGKFYKTRDGRKVGPMRKAHADTDVMCAEGGTHYVFADGRTSHASESYADLIAEWTTSCAAAQVDNLRDEYGPVVKPVAAGNDNRPDAGGGLKAGDRIRLISDPTFGCMVGDTFVAIERRLFDGSPGSVHYTNHSGNRTWRPGAYFELVADAVQAEPKFKVGDRVRRSWSLVDGVVKSIDGACYRIDYGSFGFRNFNESELVLVQAAIPTTPAIVALIENGQPKPADRPHVHPSRGAACNEADRLARKYPGKEFGVYELVDTRQVAVPVYDHEWQRLAAAGNTFRAANALTKVSGIPYDAAFKAAKAFCLEAAA